MSRLTGTDAKGLLEAYSAVYASQELTEEQVWEEVETWVNSLLEEGYDLSDYTWEEMYESYIEEQGSRGGASVRNQNVFTIPTSSAGTRRGTGGTAAGTRSSTTTAKPSAAPTPSRFAGARDAAFAKARQIQGSPVVGPKPAATAAGTPPPTPAATPAATPTTAPKSTPSTPSRPSSSATASKADKIKGGMDVYNKQRSSGDSKGATETGRSVSALANPTKPKTPNPLMQKTFGYQTGNSPKEQQSRADEIIKKGGVAALRPTPSSSQALSSSDVRSKFAAASAKTATLAPTTPTPVSAAPKPSLQDKIRQQRLNMSFDPFDVVIGHLIDEGYADTQESALAIMANMSEDWRESILEDYKEFPTSKVTRKAGKLMGTKDPKKTKRGIKMMDTMMQHTPD